MKNINWILIILLSLAVDFRVNAQANDDCDAAFNIADPTNYCSGLTQFTLVNSTTSTYGPPFCWNGEARDVWFKFRAVALSVDVVVNGDNVTGRLIRPQVAIYSGSCGGTITNLQCNADSGNPASNVAQVSTSLKVGEEYLIRVAGRTNTVGSFQLCVTNYNPPIVPGQDCNTGAVLCDKSNFVVQSVTGSGLIKNEGDGTCLQPTFLSSSEDQSTWFKWTAADNGTLTFDINPLKGDDDIDFAFYEMSNLNTCGGKSVLRCVATACEGPTGIRLGENENSEDQGCEPGENGYVRSITQTAGKHYALLVNNFTQSKVGFKVNFGGTGTFLGPQPNFTAVPDPNCGTKFKITYTGPVVAGTKYTWAFGDDASTQTANTAGPFDINYDGKTGERFVTLTLESASGCKVTKSTKITLGSCCSAAASPKLTTTILAPNCNGDKNGSVDLAASGGTSPYQFRFDTSPLWGVTNYQNLASGNYKAVVIDSKGCRDSINVLVPVTPPIVVDAGPDRIVGGGTTINLSATYSPVVAGDTYFWFPPMNFANPALLSNTTTVDTTTTYYIYVTTAKKCSGVDSVKITATCNPQALPKVTTIVRPPLCKGTSTGKIELMGSGGLGKLTYSLGNDAFKDSLIYQNIKAGDYRLRVKDAKGCIDSVLVRVPDPAGITLNAGPDITADFRDTIILSGAYTPKNAGDKVQWTSVGSIIDPTNLSAKAVALADGIFVLSVTNNDRCTFSDSLNLKVNINCTKITPPSISVIAPPFVCTNANNAIISAKATGLNPPFTYSIDNKPYVQDSTFRNIGPGRYIVSTRDRLGCIGRDTIEIDSADVYKVDAGPDQEVELGEAANLVGNYSPVNNGDSITWSPINLVTTPSSLATEVSPSGTTTFKLNIKSYQGCIYTDSVVVKTSKAYKLVTANIFKPGSTSNGNFALVGSKTAKLVDKLDIFDRWGNKVYSGKALDPKDPIQGWDGTFNGDPLPTDVYIWIATVRFLDDNTQIFQGDVTLLR
jgi:gliding motility-associated-like protein